MLDAFVEGLAILFQWKSLLYMLIGAAIGFWVGILPGLGGPTTLALMIPFIYKMTPQEAIPFLLGMHSVLSTTGDITSVLFGIPGEPSTVATILDGHAMAKKGEGGRALSAVLMSSLIGAIVGALFLALTIPVVRPLVLAFGTPEMFMVIILSLTCIATLSGEGRRGLFLGIMIGGAGLLLSLVGQDPNEGFFRFTFGSMYLWDGIPLIPFVIGLFAIPEIIDMASKGTGEAIDLPPGELGKGITQGLRDTIRHFSLTVRCSIIGAFIGMLPGLGGGIAQWVAYAHAKQSVRTAAEAAGFGQGDVRGVLGPGAANNSREGGCLIPTVAFGIPAGSSMAILLGAFFLLGVIPGPDMLTKHLALTFSMVWTIVIANIFAVAVSFMLINHLAKLTMVRGNLMIPFILLLTLIGAYTASNNLIDIVTALVSGAVGYFMVRFGWPRPPLILGFILGNLAETYFYTSVDLYGAAWLVRPGVMAILCLSLGVALYPKIKRFKPAIETENRGVTA